jgi:4-amino-4-deoxychorismate lyase
MRTCITSSPTFAGACAPIDRQWTRCARCFPAARSPDARRCVACRSSRNSKEEGRGAYTGSLGWLGTDGDADFNILIRTLTLRDDLIELRAGAGIVADSVPERELAETRAKARGLLARIRSGLVSAAIGSWIDGVRGETLPADDRGLHYGDGLFESIGVRAGVARFLEAHLARLASGCARLGIRFSSMAELRAEIAAALALAPPRAMLKIIVTRGSAMRRGYAPQGTESARRLMSLWPEAALPTSVAEGVALHRATFTLADNPTLAGIKHLSRIENVMAAGEVAAAGAFEALLLDGSGHVISGAMSNVFLVRDGQVLTPRLDRCGVAGVMRRCGAA